MNPYAKAARHQMWRRGVSRVEPHLLDPVIDPKFKIERQTAVGTAGSCFAQHIARKIRDIGFNYFVPESGDDLPETERSTRQFGVFSGRYGNLYTVAQLLQLFEEVFEGRARHETAWQRPDGRFVDPYRPQVEPEGFASAAEVTAARVSHLAATRRVFAESELFIFTLGLTEAWRSRLDQSVFPLAPGVVADSFDPERHEFHNFTVDEVTRDLLSFLSKLKAINPKVKTLLTVSPVPLIATYEKRHVLTSTVYSKSVLRVAAQAGADRFDWVDYFPSYEVITSSSTGGMYFENDYREVSPQGVAHAMRAFVRNYVNDDAIRVIPALVEDVATSAYRSASDIICDEEAIDAIRT
jgi:hypothetical protein